jgi:hypothetical protein
VEARVGIEPTYKGFADLSLTTWVPRHSPLGTLANAITQAAKVGEPKLANHWILLWPLYPTKPKRRFAIAAPRRLQTSHVMARFLLSNSDAPAG